MADQASLLLRMPQRLKDRIVNDAWKRKTNQTAVVLEILSEHYGIPYTPTIKRTVPFGGGRKGQS